MRPARVHVALLGLGMAVSSASCALKFTDYPADGSGAGGNGGSTIESASSSAADQSASSSSAQTGSGGAAPACTRAVLAIDHLFIGDKNPDGTPWNSPWKQYGADIDGQNTTSDYTNHCAPKLGGDPDNVFSDGHDGIDNSFGDNFIPMFPSFSDGINANIASGNIGYLFDIVNLTAEPNQIGIMTRFYSGAQPAEIPRFDGYDCWPVDGAAVTDPNDVTTSKVVLEQGLLAEHLWVSGLPQTLEITLKLQTGTPLTLTLHNAKVWAQLTPDHQNTDSLGQISGVLDTEEFVLAFRRFARAFDPAYCGSAALENWILKIRQSSDIMVDGTQDPNAACNGISVGLGFTAKRVLLGDVGPASPPPSMPCPDP